MEYLIGMAVTMFCFALLIAFISTRKGEKLDWLKREWSRSNEFNARKVEALERIADSLANKP